MAGGIHAFTVQEGINAQLGQGGYMFLDQAGGSGGGAATDNTGTAATGVEYVALTILEAATVTTVSNDTSIYPNLSTITVPAGTTPQTAAEDADSIAFTAGANMTITGGTDTITFSSANDNTNIANTDPQKSIIWQRESAIVAQPLEVN